MSVEGDRKQSVDAKLKKQCFSYNNNNNNNNNTNILTG